MKQPLFTDVSVSALFKKARVLPNNRLSVYKSTTAHTWKNRLELLSHGKTRYNGVCTLSTFCNVDGYDDYLDVVPSELVTNEIAKSMLMVTGYSFNLEFIIRDNDVALFCRCNQIIGSRLVATFPKQEVLDWIGTLPRMRFRWR